MVGNGHIRLITGEFKDKDGKMVVSSHQHRTARLLEAIEKRLDSTESEIKRLVTHLTSKAK